MQESKKLRPVIVERVGLIGIRSQYKWDDGHHHANVRKIIGECSSASKTIASIKFEYGDGTDEKFWPLEAHGQTDGNNSPAKEIQTGENNKRPTSIVGVWEEGNIKYLEFYAGEAVVGDIGVDEENNETRKVISLPNGTIVGFYGWISDRHLCGIGAYIKREPIRRGVPFHNKEYSGVREIWLWYDKINSTTIRAIRFVYVDGSEKFEPRHYPGPIAPKKDAEIALDYPREYLISISGCTGEKDVIRSLTFHSNRYTYSGYPPVKEEEEEERSFWYPSTGSRITGFYGTFDNNALQSIGVYADAIPRSNDNLIKIGPFGDTGHGVEWDDGVHTDVRAFRVSSANRRLQSISFLYDDNSSLVDCPRRGGGDAGKWIWLDFPTERLISITVWADTEGEETIISHLKITTNAHTYGPYPVTPNGKQHKNEIKLSRAPKPDTRVGLRYNRVGFFGRAGTSYVNAIGAHFEQN